MDFIPLEIFEKYEIRKKLSADRLGRTYEAFHKHMRVKRKITILHFHHVKNENAKNLFITEARAKKDLVDIFRCNNGVLLSVMKLVA